MKERDTSRSRRSGRDDASPEDRSLVISYVAGEPDAVATLQQWIQRALRRRYPGLADEHDDLTQICLEKLLVSLRAGKFTGGKGLAAYVSGVVHHAAIDRLREIYRGRVLADELSSESREIALDNPYDAAEMQDESRLIYQALAAVPSVCRELWQLMLNEKLTYEEIAEKLSVPVGTVKSRMWHCRRKARSALRRLRLLHGSKGTARRRS